MNVAARTTHPAGVDGAGGPTSRWSTRVEWFDWLVVGATVSLAALTVWVGSSVVRGSWDYIFVSLGWAVVGAAWAVTLLLRATDRVARFAILVLLVGALVTVALFGPITLLIFSSPSGWIGIGMLVMIPVALILILQRPFRLIWFVAPVIVVAATAIVLSGVPQAMRFAIAEPDLTRFVQAPDLSGATPTYDEPVVVGGIPVFEMTREDGQILLVTGFIGILGDDPSGLAYAPDGPPVGVSSDHITGPWYRWVPSGYVME
jgi:hypothetical protein